MDILVGYTGFVGQNLIKSHDFDLLFNSKNIAEAFGTKPDLLVYSGVPAEMFLANNNPAADRLITETAAENIRKINPKRLVLISTIAVLDKPIKAYEDTLIDPEGLTAYGLNRLELEKSVRGIVADSHIIRLPALFGEGIKKNFIYDLVSFFPAMLNQAKYGELSALEPIIADNYEIMDNGFYKLTASYADRPKLKAAFLNLNFSSLNFTDSRSVFQYYNLAYLFGHLKKMVKHNIPLLNAATEPISAALIYEHIYGKTFKNELAKLPFAYDFRTKYDGLFGGENGYLFSREQVLLELKDFVLQFSGF
ncbi:MAG: NAD(P)-dependent oxidoreductase [Lachnospiraceae bacterium]|nr:NAD(P)-dependent oxidoreductase [Lachnospiraceae bacterium]